MNELTRNPRRWLRVAALRVVASLFGLIAAVCILVLLSIPIAALWPELPIKTPHGWMLWRDAAIIAILGFATGRTALLLWKRRRTGAIFALPMLALTITANYYGPMRGTQAVGLAVAMLALLLVGWRELE